VLLATELGAATEVFPTTLLLLIVSLFFASSKETDSGSIKSASNA
jgi:uncharacterized membrane protein YtjA (UPF0391 family)